MSYYDVVIHVQEFFVLYQFGVNESHRPMLHWNCALSDRSLALLHTSAWGPDVGL